MASDGPDDGFDDDWEEWNPSQTSFLTHMIAGSFAGVMEHVGMFPVDTYKVRAHALPEAPLQLAPNALAVPQESLLSPRLRLSACRVGRPALQDDVGEEASETCDVPLLLRGPLVHV